MSLFLWGHVCIMTNVHYLCYVVTCVVTYFTRRWYFFPFKSFPFFPPSFLVMLSSCLYQHSSVFGEEEGFHWRTRWRARRGGGTLNFINSVPNFPLSLAFSFSFTGRVIREESALKRLILGDQALLYLYSSLLCYEVTPTIRFFFLFWSFSLSQLDTFTILSHFAGS